jgi:hypothetical protein
MKCPDKSATLNEDLTMLHGRKIYADRMQIYAFIHDLPERT